MSKLRAQPTQLNTTHSRTPSMHRSTHGAPPISVSSSFLLSRWNASASSGVLAELAYSIASGRNAGSLVTACLTRCGKERRGTASQERRADQSNALNAAASSVDDPAAVAATAVATAAAVATAGTAEELLRLSRHHTHRAQLRVVRALFAYIFIDSA